MALRLSTALVNELMTPGGQSFADVFANGYMEIFAGSQPATADMAEGTALVRITLNGGAFTPGTATNGLNFDDAVAGTIGIPSGDIWTGTVSVSGNAGWARFYPNAAGHTGADTEATKIRFDVAAITEMVMVQYSLVATGDATVNTMAITQPMQ